jgi:hypothetical protein
VKPTAAQRRLLLETKLAKLRKACTATEKLLFGDLAGQPCAVTAKPNLVALNLQLMRLSAVYSFNCLELAKILTCSAKLLPASSPVQDAIGWLLVRQKNLPVEFSNPDGLAAIQKAANAGDAQFFVRLAQGLKDFRKRKPPRGPDALRFALVRWWKPRGNWPGLAYCKLAARVDFLGILEKNKVLDCEFTKKVSPHNLDNIRLRLGLIPSKHPFISVIEATKSGSTLHFLFS